MPNSGGRHWAQTNYCRIKELKGTNYIYPMQ